MNFATENDSLKNMLIHFMQKVMDTLLHSISDESTKLDPEVAEGLELAFYDYLMIVYSL
jgi:hypothetical protein